MEKKTTIYTSMALLLMLPSCSQEGPGHILMEEGRSICFRTYLPSVTETRAEVVTNDDLKECVVTCFNSDSAELTDDSGEMIPYFSGKVFTKHDDGHFLAEDASSTLWPNSTDRLHFFASWPSDVTMREKIDTAGFKLANHSRIIDGKVAFDYIMKGFKVAGEIAEQVDFISAYASSTQQETGYNPIDIRFRHNLARVELSAWCASERYEFEIAGVRIGNAVTEGDFDFSSLLPEADVAPWIIAEGKQSNVEHIFGAGESIVLLSKERESHSSSSEAASVMGSAGCAMVIPMNEKIEAWEGKADPAINDKDYSTDKLYFSLLLRVINRDGEVVYPYPNNCDFIPVVYLVVGDKGEVIRRVYMIDGAYYTANEKNDDLIYVPSDSEEICGFCWAALPVSGGAKWDAGKVYSYKLNYTNGIGWQDPDDPTPGEPIIERGMVPFEVSVEDWVEADGHDPDLDVPRR